jgi:hypothetical protein
MECSINSSTNQFESTLSLFQEIGSPPNRTQQHGEDIPRLTLRHDWTNTEAATSRGTGRSYVNRNT